MRKALRRPVQRARSWCRRYGRLGAPQTPRPVKQGPQAVPGRSLEDWARFGGGLLGPEFGDAPRPEIRADRGAALGIPISPPG